MILMKSGWRSAMISPTCSRASFPSPAVDTSPVTNQLTGHGSMERNNGMGYPPGAVRPEPPQNNGPRLLL